MGPIRLIVFAAGALSCQAATYYVDFAKGADDECRHGGARALEDPRKGERFALSGGRSHSAEERIGLAGATGAARAPAAMALRW